MLSMEQREFRYQLNYNEVVSELLDGEVIVIHLQTGIYYSMLTSAADLWGALVGGWTANEIIVKLAGGGGDKNYIEKEVVQFIESLLAEKLIEPASDISSAPRSNFEPAAAFAAPLFEKYTDMQELLLVDPIHEVTEQGWPIRVTPGK